MISHLAEAAAEAADAAEAAEAADAADETACVRFHFSNISASIFSNMSITILLCGCAVSKWQL